MDEVKCLDCNALGRPSDVICQKCGGEIVPVTAADPGNPSDGGTRAAAGRGRNLRRLFWLLIIAAVVVAGYLLWQSISAPLKASADSARDKILVTNNSDKSVTVVIKRKTKNGNWVDVPSKGRDRTSRRVKAGDTVTVNLDAGTYRAVSGSEQSHEVKLDS